MPLFGHHREDARQELPAGIPGLAEVAVAQGWQPVSGQPFDGHLEDAVHDITRCMYGVPRQMPTVAQHGVRIGGTVFRDAFRGNISGRAVIVANAWTSIEPELRQSTGDVKGAAVCAVELPSMLPIACVQPRRFPAVMLVRNTPTGDPAFDDLFAVAALPDAGQQMQVLTPDLRQRIIARDDWVSGPSVTCSAASARARSAPSTRSPSGSARCWPSWPQSRRRCCPITSIIPKTT
jgi:hypothetical protein